MSSIKTLPLFPLNIVAFPGERINLHIFEERYKELIGDCIDGEEGNNTFGIPTYFDERVRDFGTEMRIVDVVKKYPDGKMDIRLEGLNVFRIIEFYELMPFKKYSGAKVSFRNINLKPDLQLHEEMRILVEELFYEVGLHKEIDDFNSYSVAHYIGMSLEQEYDLLTTLTESERAKKIISHLKKAIPSVKQTRKIKDRIQMNGHFQKLQPPF